MVPVDPLKHFDGHPKERRRIPKISTVLHHPSRGCMSQSMRRDMLLDARRLDRCGETVAYRAHRLPVPLDHGVFCDAYPKYSCPNEAANLCCRRHSENNRR